LKDVYSPRRQHVLRAIDSWPGASIRDVATALGVHSGTADYHLRVLLKARVIVRERHGRAVRHYPAWMTRTERERFQHQARFSQGASA
jgi:predicted transcriptional regulator